MAKEAEEVFVPWTERPGYEDVVPVKQNEGQLPPCRIAYTPEFEQTMDVFRALVQANELTSRSLAVCDAVLRLNAGNYTAWYFRRKVLTALHAAAMPGHSAAASSASSSSSSSPSSSSSAAAVPKPQVQDAAAGGSGGDAAAARAVFVAERAFASGLGLRNPKNYQVWFHRRWVVEQLRACGAPEESEPCAPGDGKSWDAALGAEEMAFGSEVLAEDNKNYHTWAHRQWVVETLGLWDDELAYADSMVLDDVMNNSAWNQRMFVVTRKGARLPLDDATRQAETEWALTYLRKRPNNESPWSYIKGLYRRAPPAAAAGAATADGEGATAGAAAAAAAGGAAAATTTTTFHDFTPAYRKLLEELRGRYITSPHPAALLVDLHEDEGTEASRAEAAELCRILAENLDNIHSRYWTYRRSTLQ